MKILDVGCCDNPQGDINIDLYFNHLERLTKPDILAHACYLPFHNNSFELVYSNHLIEHLENPYALLRELARVSKKYVYVATPNKQNWRFFLLDVLDSYLDPKAHRFQGFTQKELSQMFVFANLQIQKISFSHITDPDSGEVGTRKLDSFLKWLPRFNCRQIGILGMK